MPRKRVIRVLGIETSCDETAAAVVFVSRQPQGDSRKPCFVFDVRSNVIASQVKIHAKYGGVVPEVAAREHVGKIIPVIEEALRGGGVHPLPRLAHSGWAGINLAPTLNVDAIAVTAGPGLITALSVGAETARSLAYAWEKPLIVVNHIEGHVLSALLPQSGKERRTQNAERKTSEIAFPALALIVSGGHTELLLMRGWEEYECVGATRDDAAGEAFDKVGKLLGLSYPGGPAVAKAAERGDPTAFDFPRGMINSGNFEFSFSGLKTAVRYMVEKWRVDNGELILNRKRVDDYQLSTINSQLIRDVCASFQQAVVDVLVAKTIAAAKRYGVNAVLLGGGVAANQELRRQLGDAVRTQLRNSLFFIPDSSLTGDNAAMIAAAGGVRLLLGESTPWQELDVDANWELGR